MSHVKRRDDTDKKERKSLDGGHTDGGVGGNSGGGGVVRIIVDGDREDADEAPTLGKKTGEHEQNEKEKSDKRAGKSKRRRPANRCTKTIALHVWRPRSL